MERSKKMAGSWPFAAMDVSDLQDFLISKPTADKLKTTVGHFLPRLARREFLLGIWSIMISKPNSGAENFWWKAGIWWKNWIRRRQASYTVTALWSEDTFGGREGGRPPAVLLKLQAYLRPVYFKNVAHVIIWSYFNNLQNFSRWRKGWFWLE